MRKQFVGAVVGLTVALGATGAAVAASSAPSKATVKVSQKIKFKPNRYVQDGLRWDRDVYKVKSGGTVTVINTVATEGPHTLTAVKRKDLPRTAGQVGNCKICNTLGAAHGANPESNTPPQFQYLENGVGQNTPPSFDRPGDSGVTGPGQKGEKISFKVTAKKGTKLYLLCLIHPWMQARLDVR